MGPNFLFYPVPILYFCYQSAGRPDNQLSLSVDRQAWDLQDYCYYLEIGSAMLHICDENHKRKIEIQ